MKAAERNGSLSAAEMKRRAGEIVAGIDADMAEEGGSDAYWAKLSAWCHDEDIASQKDGLVILRAVAGGTFVNRDGASFWQELNPSSAEWADGLVIGGEE